MNAHAPNDAWGWIWGLGYRAIVPIKPNDKAPGVLTEDGWVGLKTWQRLYPSAADVDRYRNMGAGIGIRCEKGLLAIDADTMDAALSAAVETEITARVGTLPQRIGQAPKKLFLLRTTPDYFHPKILFDGGQIDVRTYGQFVASGVHPKTGANYQWVRALPPAEDLPFVAPSDLNTLWAALRDLLPNGRFTGSTGLTVAVDPETLRGSVARVRRALELTPNDYADRNTYINVLTAVRGALPDDLEDAWDLVWPWCETWRGPNGEENEEDVVRRDFDSLKPQALGIGFLEDVANTRSHGSLIAERYHEDPVETRTLSPGEESIFPPEEKIAPPPPPNLTGTPYDFPDLAALPPREFLYGTHYLRRYVSATIAPTKVGKSSLGVVEALAMCSGKPLLGVRPTGLWRVRIWNGEDPREELVRRIGAAMTFHGLTREDIGDRLLVDSGRDMPICTAKMVSGATTVVAPVMGALEAALRAQRVDVLIIDPFVKSHGVSENDNVAIDAVARQWNELAGRCGAAVDLVHHSRKMNGGEASIEDARGASALVSAARSARVLARMTKREGERAGRSKDHRRFFRFADASSNMAAPASEDEAWMELTSVDLHNAIFADDGALKWPSDQVGVVRLSSVRGALDEEETSEAHLEAERAALTELASGDWRQDSQSRDAWAGVPIARAYGLSLDDLDDKMRVKTILKAWIKSGKLITESRRDATRQPRSFVKTVEQVVISRSISDLFG